MCGWCASGHSSVRIGCGPISTVVMVRSSRPGWANKETTLENHHPGARIGTGIATVNGLWSYVRTPMHYGKGKLVVVATPISTEPVIAEVTAVGTAGFKLRARNLDGTKPRVATPVSWFAINVGVHELGNGATIEARRFKLAANNTKHEEAGRTFTPTTPVASPVVIGQVHARGTATPPRTFWATGPRVDQAPTADRIRIGATGLTADWQKQTFGGFIVIEAGVHQINGFRLDAGLSDTLVNGQQREIAVGVDPVTAVLCTTGAPSTPRQRLWASLHGPTADEATGTTGVLGKVRSEGDKATERRVAHLAIDTHAATARFAEQAGWGGHFDDLRAIARLGYPEWIARQANEPVSILLPFMDHIAGDATANNGNNRKGGGGNNVADMAYNLTTPWLRNLLWGSDQLRQRVGFCLSQIFVVSGENNQMVKAGASLADYYDTLARHALGNFRDLLSAVTYHPAMAYYLSSVANEKADASGTRQPDENYAREMMQLFTIGLWELNPDGTAVTTSEGERIPTYGNVEVNTLASVFTGLFYNLNPPYGADDAFGDPGPRENYVASYHYSGYSANGTEHYSRVPLGMYENYHDHTQKQLFGKSIPAVSGTGQRNIPADLRTVTGGGLFQIEAALDILFNHANVGPFIGKRLIQALVTSNPSPNYVQRVTEVFADDGTGVRGNLHAVVTQILLDPEARDNDLTDPGRGKICEPLVRLGVLARAFRLGKDQSREPFDDAAPIYWTEDLRDLLQQQFLMAPSVFGFFPADYEIERGVLAPEAGILNPLSIAGREHLTEKLLFPVSPTTNDFQGDFSEELALLNTNDRAAQNRLLDRLDVLVTHGQMTEASRATLTAALDLAAAAGMSAGDRLKVVVILAAMSADANVLL